MTRREEIIAEAKKHEYDWGVDVDRFDVPDIFAKGAEWADKTIIDKAVKWLKKYTYQDCLGVSPIARLKVGFSSVEELIEDFRKTMEE